jgi:hypothetical protein
MMPSFFKKTLWALCMGFVAVLFSCEKAVEHTAPAVNPRDSVPVMVTYGVNTLISDSGVVKYRIVTERYEVNKAKEPSRWIFDKGIFLEEFDENFHVQLYIQCDTAYYYDTQRLWELRGRVRVKTKDGVRFYSEELFRDENLHELYSNKFSRLITPDRQLQGNYFRSDERMTRYYVSNSKGSFARTDIAGKNDTLSSAPDTMKVMLRPSAIPQRRYNFGQP